MPRPYSNAGNRARLGRSVRGFTLVELLIAMTLLGLMLTVLFSSLHLAGRAWDRGEERMGEAGDVLRVQGFLRGRLAQARLVPLPDHFEPRRNDEIVFDGQPRRLYFVAPMPAHRGGGGLHLQELGLTEDGRLVFSHRLYHQQLDSLTEGQWRTTTLLDGVEEVTFRYHGRRIGEEHRGWRGSWRGQTYLPQLIEMQVRFADGDARSWPLMAASTGITERAGRTPEEAGFGP